MNLGGREGGREERRRIPWREGGREEYAREGRRGGREGGICQGGRGEEGSELKRRNSIISQEERTIVEYVI